MGLCKITTNKSGIAKEFNLEFDTKFGYYIGDPYRDNKGNYLPTFMYYNGNVFNLKYVDGCFNPYLNMLDKKDFGLIVENAKVIKVVKANTPKLQAYYQKIYGQSFSMI